MGADECLLLRHHIASRLYTAMALTSVTAYINEFSAMFVAKYVKPSDSIKARKKLVALVQGSRFRICLST